VRLAADVKPQFGPTLPELVAERLGTLPPRLRVIAGAVVAALVAVALLAALRGGASSFGARAQGVAFSFSYSGLRREPAPPGDAALFTSRTRSGRLVARLSVAPLELPRHAGNVTGIEPVFAADYMRSFASANPGAVLDGAAPTLVDGIAGYDFTYTRRIAGETYYGRVIFLTPSTAPGVRAGVTVSLLAQPFSSGIITPGSGGLAGALYEPGQGGVGVMFQPSGRLALPLASFRLAAAPG